MGAVLNIGLDPVFIYAFDMGVAGAAIATAISQFVSTLVYLTYALRKKSAFSFSIKDFKPSKQIYMEVLKIGVPTLTFVSDAVTPTFCKDTDDTVPYPGMGGLLWG